MGVQHRATARTHSVVASRGVMARARARVGARIGVRVGIGLGLEFVLRLGSGSGSGSASGSPTLAAPHTTTFRRPSFAAATTASANAATPSPVTALT